MLGGSGVGKTTFMASMYAKLRDGSSGISMRAVEDRVDLKLNSVLEALYNFNMWPPATVFDQASYGFELFVQSRLVAYVDWIDYRGGALFEGPNQEGGIALVQRLRESDAILWMVDMTRLSSQVGGLRERMATGVARMAAICRHAIQGIDDPRTWIFVRTKADTVQDDDGRINPDRAVDELMKHLGATIEIAHYSKFSRGAALAVSSVGRLDTERKLLGDDPMNVEWPLLLALALSMEGALAQARTHESSVTGRGTSPGVVLTPRLLGVISDIQGILKNCPSSVRLFDQP